jgi:hypothetical protein
LHEGFTGYPKEILAYNYAENLDLCFNNGVFDVEHGLILKLAEGGLITHALRGY